jgi:hypothetical protein
MPEKQLLLLKNNARFLATLICITDPVESQYGIAVAIRMIAALAATGGENGN